MSHYCRFVDHVMYILSNFTEDHLYILSSVNRHLTRCCYWVMRCRRCSVVRVCGCHHRLLITFITTICLKH